MELLKGEFGLCTDCNICLLVCSARAVGGFNPRRARLKVALEEENLVNRPLVCSQCEVAFCERSCPVEAIYKDPETMAVLIKKDVCTGCGLCLDACPDGMILLDEAGKADKCDLCGGNPQCVPYCAPGALKRVKVQEVEKLA